MTIRVKMSSRMVSNVILPDRNRLTISTHTSLTMQNGVVFRLFIDEGESSVRDDDTLI